MIQDDVSKISIGLLIKSLRSSLCPSCGQGKASGKTVCGACWRALKPATGVALYHGVRRGYEPAFAQAMNELSPASLKFPGAERIAPGAYRTPENQLHLDVPEVLRLLNCADTPANRDEACRICMQIVDKLMPGIPAEVV